MEGVLFFCVAPSFPLLFPTSEPSVIPHLQPFSENNPFSGTRFCHVSPPTTYLRPFHYPSGTLEEKRSQGGRVRAEVAENGTEKMAPKKEVAEKGGGTSLDFMGTMSHPNYKKIFGVTGNCQVNDSSMT